MEQEAAFIPDATKLWNIETPDRVVQEREKAKLINSEVRQKLDSQVRQNADVRQQSRE